MNTSNASEIRITLEQLKTLLSKYVICPDEKFMEVLRGRVMKVLERESLAAHREHIKRIKRGGDDSAASPSRA